jgi:N-acetylmuramoyl-L-alanine amidase
MEMRSLLLWSGAAFLGIGAVMGLSSGAAGVQPSSGGCGSCDDPDTCQPISPGAPPVLPPASTPSAPIDTLARTLWGEARGEGYQGMQAVADVVMNRVHAGNFPGGSSIAGVCRAPNQFSCWNANDPNRPLLLAVTATNPQFAQALEIAAMAAAGTLPDITDGATYYHESSIATPRSWGAMTQTAEIGNHIFYAKATG